MKRFLVSGGFFCFFILDDNPIEAQPTNNLALALLQILMKIRQGSYPIDVTP